MHGDSVRQNATGMGSFKTWHSTSRGMNCANIAVRTDGSAEKCVIMELAKTIPSEEDLGNRESQYRSILDILPGYFVIISPTGDIEFYHRRLGEFTGAPLDEHSKWKSNDLIHPDDRAGVVQAIEHCLRTGEDSDIEYRLKRFDGVYRWFNSRGRPQRNDNGDIVRWCFLLVDVDDRKRAEEELLKRQQELSAIVESIPAFVIVLDPAGAVESANSQTFKYLEVTLDELRDWAGGAFIHPEDHAFTMENFARSIAKGEEFENELRLRRHDGAYRWFHSRSLPLRNRAGKIENWYVLLTDIDRRKRAEGELGEREGRLSSILEILPAYVVVLSPKGDIEFLHQKMTEYTGGTVDTHQGWKGNDLIHPDDRVRVVQAMDDSLRTGDNFDVEYRSRRFDGVYRWFNSRGRPQRNDDGEIARWCFLLVDIDDRKQAEEELRRNQAFIVEGQSLSQTGTFYWNTQTNERRFSDELYRLMEIEPGTVITDELLASRVHPDDHELLQQKIEAGQRNQGGLDYEIRLKGPSGRVRWVHTIGRSYQGENGSLDYIGAVRDITERHSAEEVLSKLRSELTHMARVTSLGALTASIAHEVNQPLAGILTNASTGLRMLASDPPNVSGALETARRTIRDANRASDVITRLRAMFTRKETASEGVQLNDAAQEVIALSLTELQRNRLAILTEFADDLPVIQGDRVQLQQVILNLLLNASDAMKSVADRPREILIKTAVGLQNEVRLIVRDSGVGIDPDIAAKMFDPFYTTKNSGMGIGLSISRDIIELHGGRLWAEPNANHGTSFSFSIPNQMKGSGAK